MNVEFRRSNIICTTSPTSTFDSQKHIFIVSLTSTDSKAVSVHRITSNMAEILLPGNGSGQED
jgi:hypothetical protein